MLLLNFLLLVVVLIAGYIMGFPVTYQYNIGKGKTGIVNTVFIGLLLISTAELIFRLVHIPSIYVAIIPLIILIFIYKKISLPSIKIQPKYLFVHLSLFLFIYLHVFVQGFRMGLGNFPKEYYNVDAPAYLSLLHGYLKAEVYPAINLDVLGGSVKYHFGSIALAALFCKFALLKAHTVLFIIIPILFLIVVYTNIYKICFSIIGNHFWLVTLATMLILLLLNFSFNTLEIKKILKGVFKIGLYGKSFPLISSLGALSVITIILNSIVSIRGLKDLLPLVVLMPLIGLQKLPFMPVFLVIVVSYILIYFRFKLTLRLFSYVLLMISLSASLAYFISYSTEMSMLTLRGTNAIKIGFFYNELFYQLLTYVTYLLPISLIIIYKEKINKKYIILLSLNIVLPLIPLALIKIDNPDYFQFFLMVLPITTILVIPLLLSAFNEIKPIVKKIVWLNLLAPILLVLTSNLYYLKLLYTNKENAQSYCNNQSIAQALATIPLNKTVIATNDLRYPADNFKRDNKQFQISSIWGHQALGVSSYFVDVKGENYYKASISISKQLQNSNDLTAGIIYQLQANYVTHVLIHKNYPYPKKIGFGKLFENDNYLVYALP